MFKAKCLISSIRSEGLHETFAATRLFFLITSKIFVYKRPFLACVLYNCEEKSTPACRETRP